MAVKFGNISDLKRQGVKGFPIPMAKQMAQPTKVRKLRFPSPERIKRGAMTF